MRVYAQVSCPQLGTGSGRSNQSRAPWSAQAGAALACPLSHATLSLWKFPHFLCPGYSSSCCIYHPGDTVARVHTCRTRTRALYTRAGASRYARARGTCLSAPTTKLSRKIAPTLLLLHSVLPPPTTSKHGDQRDGLDSPPTPCQPGRPSHSLTTASSFQPLLPHHPLFPPSVSLASQSFPLGHFSAPVSLSLCLSHSESSRHSFDPLR